MPVQIQRNLLVLMAVAALGLVLAACGSTLGAPPESRFSAVTATPAQGTPTDQLTGMAKQGYQLYRQFSCGECHSLQGQVIVGPPLNGLYGSKVLLTTGQTVVADDAYLKLSILEPDAQIVNGFQSGIMSGHIMQFQSKIATGNNLQALIAFLKSQS